MVALRSALVACCAYFATGCTSILDQPLDYTAPIQQIFLHAACELRDAFIDLDKPRYASFGANRWLVAIALSPKTDKQVAGGIGLTGKSTSIANPSFLNSWTWGSVSSPGAAFDIKGTRNASITYQMTSKDLLNVKQFPLQCLRDGPTYHVLAENLGIRAWLLKTVESHALSIGPLAKIDKPSFSSQIVVKYSGNGSFTYTFPFGTNFASLSGLYDLDETLSITLSPDTQTKTLVVRTLPSGGKLQDTPPSRVVIQTSTVDPQSRLDAFQLQQTLIDAVRNLPR